MRAALVLFLLAATSASAAEPPRRIAVAGSGLTEIVYALGAADRLVAVDTTSLFPSAARKLPQMGYLRTLGAEGIASVRPDLLIAAEEAGPPATIAQLAAAGVRVLRAGDGYDAAAVVARVGTVGRALGLEAKAADVAAAVEADFARLARDVAGLKRPRVLFVLSAGGGAPMAAGRETAASSIIELAGAANAVDAYRGYKPLSPEALVAARPDAILATDQTLAALGGLAAFRALPQFATLRDTPVVTLDAVYLLGFGPRTAHAAHALARALHPQAELAPMPARAWLADAP